jgi:hypothetical protein
MTAFALPRRRQSKPAKLAKGAAKAWTAMKLGSIAGRAARKAAKAYGSLKVTKFVAKRGGKVLLIPLAAGGGLAAWRKLRSGPEEPAPFGSSYGPAATPQTVSPPTASNFNGPAGGTPAPRATPPGAAS